MRFKRSDIQVLRGLAVLLVILFHLDISDNSGFLGVDVFFVISGYVITSSLMQRAEGQSSLAAARAFVARRFKRLTPALMCMLLVTLLLSTIFLSPFDLLPTTVVTAISALFGLGNIAIALESGNYFAQAAELNPLLHTWSLGVEEQFYGLVAFLLLIGIKPKSGRVPFKGSIITLIFIASLAAFIVGSSGYAIEGWQTVLGFYSPVARSWEIAAGVLIALSQIRFAQWTLPSALRNALSLSSLVGILYLASYPAADGVSRGALTIAVVALTCSVITFGIENKIAAHNIMKPFLSVGNYSYSAYLWHWPVIKFVPFILDSRFWQLFVSLTLMWLLTWISGRYIEFALLRPKAGLKKSVHRLLMFSSSTVISCVALGAASLTFSYPESKFAEGDNDLKQSVPCDYTDNFLEPCFFSFGSDEELFIAGDSTALPYFFGAMDYARNHQLNLRFTSSNGCPAGQPGIRYPRVEPCLGWQKEVYEFVGRSKPKEIWIINRGGAYTTPALGFYGILDESGRVLVDSREIQIAWRDSLASLISQSPESLVTIFHNAPEIIQGLDERTLFNALIGFDDPAQFFSPSLAEERRSAAVNAEQGLASDNVRIIDPFEALCFEGRCSYKSVEGDWLYWDGSHLSQAGADKVLSHFEKSSK